MEALVTNLETAKKLKTAGFPQETEYLWRDPQAFTSPEDMSFVEHRSRQRVTSEGMITLAAPTAQEIADQLPKNNKGLKEGSTGALTVYYGQLDNMKWRAGYEVWEADELWGVTSGDNLAEALANLYLALAEDKMKSTNKGSNK
jgi:hypothetical protein